MNLRFWKRKKKDVSTIQSALRYTASGMSGNAMALSSVYRCVEVISNSIAQMPLEPYKLDADGFKKKYVHHPTYLLLSKEPNRRMTRYTYIKTMVSAMLLNGNAYSYIVRDEEGVAKELIYIDPSRVRPVAQEDGSVTYNINGVGFSIPSSDMIHILNVTYDGIVGISVISHATQAISLASASEAHASGFFKGGANTAGILKVQGVVSKEQAKQIKASWSDAFTPGTGQPNGVAILQGNMDYTPITINPADAQLLETRRYNMEDICRFFGVSPVKCGDLTKSSYSTVEATQLAFLTDTIAPILEKIELEFERKLYGVRERWQIDVRFDTSVLLRADKGSEADYYTKLFYLGVLSPNEIRQRLDLEPIDGGDAHYLQVNLQDMQGGKLSDIITNTKKIKNERSKKSR